MALRLAVVRLAMTLLMPFEALPAGKGRRSARWSMP
jgi:hypothetical protein